MTWTTPGRACSPGPRRRRCSQRSARPAEEEEKTMAMILRAMPSTCREVDSPSGTAPSWRERRRRRRRRKTQGRHSTDVSLPPLHPILLRVRVPRRGHGTSSARDATNPALGQQKRPKRAEWCAKKKDGGGGRGSGNYSRQKHKHTHIDRCSQT